MAKAAETTAMAVSQTDAETQLRDSQSRRRDKEATKRALLEAAVEVFAARGFDGATTREVAAKAGVNEGLIQRYFGGKAGLLEAIVGGLCSEKKTACKLAPSCGCLETEITRFLKYEIAQAGANRNFMRVLLSRALVDPALAVMMKQYYKASRLPLLVERLRIFQAEGKLDASADLEKLAGTMAAFAFGLGFMQQVIFAEDPDYLDAIVASTAQTIARGIGGPVSA
ncbi:MAG TPA: helix-turn-helix domain-containing protein [Dongiaceae bacterium]|jgi:AcrR family transcriptional regulator